MTRISAFLAAAIALAGIAPQASAGDRLPSRALSVLTVAIASQGDAALVYIRKELALNLRDSLRPPLPRPQRTPADSPAVPPAATPSR